MSSKQVGKVGSHRSFYSSNSGRTVSKSSGPEDERRSSSDLSETGEESTTNGSKHTSSCVAGTKSTSTSDVEVVAVLKDVTAVLNRLTKHMEKVEAQLQAVAAVPSSRDSSPKQRKKNIPLVVRVCHLRIVIQHFHVTY